MHGAVTVGDYLVLVGGVGVMAGPIVQLSVYMFTCSQWTDLASLMTGQPGHMYVNIEY